MGIPEGTTVFKEWPALSSYYSSINGTWSAPTSIPREVCQYLVNARREWPALLVDADEVRDKDRELALRIERVKRVYGDMRSAWEDLVELARLRLELDYDEVDA
jgi:hypothetical protein